MTFTSIFSMTEDSIVSIFPYILETFIIIYQDAFGNCQKIKLENINGEKEKETVYVDDDKKFC